MNLLEVYLNIIFNIQDVQVVYSEPLSKIRVIIESYVHGEEIYND